MAANASNNRAGEELEEEEREEDMLDADEADEEIQPDEDAHMDSDGDQEGDDTLEIQLQNDSVAHFDLHKDSIFCIAQHPAHPTITATGGGDDTGYIVDYAIAQTQQTNQTATANTERAGIPSLFKLEGHTDSLNAITFTLPKGEYLVSAGLDGRLLVWHDSSLNLNGQGPWKSVASAQEVEEVNFLIPCPNPAYPNTIALGASDGSVWVYTINAADTASPLTIVQVFYLHTGPCTAGAWSPDGKLLATVSEDGSFYVWDVFGEAAAAGLTTPQGGQSVVGLTGQDERFRVDGGLYSVAIAPNGAFAAVGGSEGQIRIVGLPRIGAPSSSGSAGKGGSKGGAGSKAKAGGAKQPGATDSASGAGQAGQILASLAPQSESIETLSFAPPPLTLLAAGSVDGSIALFDTAHRFAVRRHIRDAHEEEAVIKVEFVKDNAWVLTSCGNDGVVRRWDTRGGTAAAAQGLLGSWRGHRGGGEGGGVLGFVQGGQGQGGRWIATAGDDGVSLIFDGSNPPSAA